MGIIISILIVIIIFLLIGNYFYNYSLNPKKIPKEVTEQDSIYKNENDEANKRWFLENNEKLYATSVTNAKIVAHKVTQKEKTNKYLIVTHGYGDSAYKLSTYIKLFYELGYNVLAPDLLGFGESEGHVVSMGGFDSSDIAMWANRIASEDKDSKIVLFGMSMGAATVMNSLNKDLPPNVKLFIEDSGYVILKDQMSYQLKKMFKLPSFPILNFVDIVIRFRGGFSISSIDARKALENTDLKGLIIHGDNDSFVPKSNALLVEKLLKNKEIHIIENSKHVEAIEKYYDKYKEIVKNFLDKNLI